MNDFGNPEENSSDRRTASNSNHCPHCGTRIAGLTCAGPGETRVGPCGHRVSDLTASRIAGDAGPEPSPRAMPDGGSEMGWAKLKPHPHELESAITGDHVVIFRYGPDTNYQFEVSGETDAGELDIDWTIIDLEPDEVDAILDDGETYTEQCEDLGGREYQLRVNGGHRHPKGAAIHTQDADGEEVDRRE